MTVIMYLSVNHECLISGSVLAMLQQDAATFRIIYNFAYNYENKFDIKGICVLYHGPLSYAKRYIRETFNKMFKTGKSTDALR
jgi:tartrate dehydratase beta subunit/fumarate hydratase class I family protein